MSKTKDFTKNLLAEEVEEETAKASKRTRKPKATEEESLEVKYCLRLPKELLEDYRNLADFTGYTIKDLVIRALSEWKGYTDTEEKRKELRKAKAGNKHLF